MITKSIPLTGKNFLSCVEIPAGKDYDAYKVFHLVVDGARIKARLSARYESEHGDDLSTVKADAIGYKLSAYEIADNDTGEITCWRIGLTGEGATTTHLSW
jgi:hypothetical protein